MQRLSIAKEILKKNKAGVFTTTKYQEVFIKLYCQCSVDTRIKNRQMCQNRPNPC